MLIFYTTFFGELTKDTTPSQPETDAAEAAARQHRMRWADNVSVAAQCCDVMMEQSKACFEKAGNLVSFELMDPERFPQFRESFPQTQLDIASKHFPMICREKPKGELIVLYTGAEV